MKKNLSVLLVSVMAMATVLTACGSKSKDAASDSASENSSADAASGSSNDIALLQNLDKLEVKTLADINPEEYVTLGEYKGVTVEVPPASVTDEDVDAYINQLIESNPAKIEITDRPIQNGDIANIDYEGKYADTGVAFDGGTAQGFDLEIGSGMFIPGFEEGLVDVEIGQTVDLPLTFPENYGNADLAGQDVVFTVTVHSVKRPKEISDELASKLSDGEATTVAAYRELVASDLTDEKKANQEANTKGEILTLVANNSTINEYPQELIDYTVNQMTDYYKSYAEAYSMNFEEFLTAAFGITEDQFMEEAEFSAKENLQQEIYVNAIAEQEDLVPDDAALKAKADELAVTYGYESGDDLIAAYGEAVVKNSIVYDEVMNFLVENTNIIEKSEAESESDFAETETDVTVLE